MKLLDQRGRIFGIINLLDLLLIVGLFFLGWRTINQVQPRAQVEEVIIVTYGLLVRNVPPYLAESITAGQELYQIKQQAYLGKVVVKEVTPAELILQQTEKLVVLLSPVNLDLRLKMRRTGKVITGAAGSGIYLGKIPIRVGERVSAQTRYTTLQAEVEYLRIKSNAK